MISHSRTLCILAASMALILQLEHGASYFDISTILNIKIRSAVRGAASVPASWWSVAAAAITLICWKCGGIYHLIRPRKVYMVDFTSLQPNEDQKICFEKAEYITRLADTFTISSLNFQRKLLLRSGLGQETYLSYHVYNEDDEFRTGECKARLEARQALFVTVDKLLGKTGIGAREIGIVIVNCSLYSPAPSMAAMIINRYGMKEDVRAYHLGGMGCSASVIACNLAKDLLRPGGDLGHL